MSYRMGVRPGKAASLVGMVIGSIFILLGIVVVAPTVGAFGILWTGVAGAITLFYAYNFFSNRGLSAYEVNVDSPDSVETLDASLRRLAKLKADGLLTDEEYEQKRVEVMRQQ